MGLTQMASDLIVYKIRAACCDLRIGDLVKPGQPIGAHYDTGALLSVAFQDRLMLAITAVKACRYPAGLERGLGARRDRGLAGGRVSA